MGNYNNYRVVGDWREPSFPDITALEGELCLGDMLEFRRNAGYAHWGIYVGPYQDMRHAVIHFGIFEGGSEFVKKKAIGIPSAASKKPEILADTIEKIFGGSGRVRINNSRDYKEEPLDPGDIIEIAKTMHQDQTQINYNLLRTNCEHFVNICRYNDPHSDQITELQTAGYLTLAIGAIGAVIGLVVTYAISRRRNERR